MKYMRENKSHPNKRRWLYIVENNQLVLEALAGDREAFIALLRQFKEPLYQTAKTILGRDEDCADAIQETFLKSFKSIHTLKKPAYFKTWLYRILIHECIAILRVRSRNIPVDEVPGYSACSPEYGRIELREAIDRLEEPVRMVIILYYLRDMTVDEIAGTMGITKGAVKMRMSRGRRTLKKWLETSPERKICHETPRA